MGAAEARPLYPFEEEQETVPTYIVTVTHRFVAEDSEKAREKARKLIQQRAKIVGVRAEDAVAEADLGFHQWTGNYLEHQWLNAGLTTLGAADAALAKMEDAVLARIALAPPEQLDADVAHLVERELAALVKTYGTEYPIQDVLAAQQNLQERLEEAGSTLQ